VTDMLQCPTVFHLQALTIIISHLFPSLHIHLNAQAKQYVQPPKIQRYCSKKFNRSRVQFIDPEHKGPNLSALPSSSFVSRFVQPRARNISTPYYGWTSSLPGHGQSKLILYNRQMTEHTIALCSERHIGWAFISYHIWIISFLVPVSLGIFSYTSHFIACSACASVWTTSISG
jgi:hypothetical protein